MAASLSLDPPLADAAVAIPLFAAARCSGDGIAGVRPTRWSRRRCRGTILCPVCQYRCTRAITNRAVSARA
jgi:hypothetical protein